MKTQIFVIYDNKADAYLPPWFVTTNAMAVRAFSDCVNDPKHNFGMHPEDYTLFKIGVFDNANANIQAHGPITMGNGVEYKNKLDHELQKLVRPPEPKEVTEIITKENREAMRFTQPEHKT